MKSTESEDWKITQNQTPIRLVIRNREGIKTNHRIRYQNKEYIIESVVNNNGRSEILFVIITE
ncbi:phage head completion protein [Staphylococcus shinii]|uniref:phage head completion protein n=1 Tax=Staphylococcus shinii TaxID=2912228 RepID=UPI00155B0F56|nr:head-tail adaptor protein [Staphylococcus shinii]